MGGWVGGFFLLASGFSFNRLPFLLQTQSSRYLEGRWVGGWGGWLSGWEKEGVGTYLLRAFHPCIFQSSSSLARHHLFCVSG